MFHYVCSMFPRVSREVHVFLPFVVWLRTHMPAGSRLSRSTISEEKWGLLVVHGSSRALNEIYL